MVHLQYWDWPKYASAPQDSPIFNGDPYSLGGNGEYIPHNGTVITPPAGVGGGDIQLPAGLGGGYVVTGPFANSKISPDMILGFFRPSFPSKSFPKSSQADLRQPEEAQNCSLEGHY